MPHTAAIIGWANLQRLSLDASFKQVEIKFIPVRIRLEFCRYRNPRVDALNRNSWYNEDLHKVTSRFPLDDPHVAEPETLSGSTRSMSTRGACGGGIYRFDKLIKTYSIQGPGCFHSHCTVFLWNYRCTAF